MVFPKYSLSAIHLHYQFQFEYLKILEKLAKEQGVQYIIVTHSEGFISNKTIGHVKRFSLNEERNSVVHAPEITEDVGVAGRHCCTVRHCRAAV